MLAYLGAGDGFSNSLLYLGIAFVEQVVGRGEPSAAASKYVLECKVFRERFLGDAASGDETHFGQWPGVGFEGSGSTKIRCGEKLHDLAPITECELDFARRHAPWGDGHVVFLTPREYLGHAGWGDEETRACGDGRLRVLHGADGACSNEEITAGRERLDRFERARRAQGELDTWQTACSERGGERHGMRRIVNSEYWEQSEACKFV